MTERTLAHSRPTPGRPAQAVTTTHANDSKADKHAARRTLFLEGPILPTVVRLSWPNVLIMVTQAGTGLIETWYLSRLGTDVLAAMAIVFPVLMLMQTVSGGAVGGGISSAIARAIGQDRRDDADAVVFHAVILNVSIGIVCSAAVLLSGPILYRALGAEGESLEAALQYSNIIFACMPLLWLMNGLAACIRGTGNLVVPAIGICGGVAILLPLSPLLIFGLGPIPSLGVAGGALALMVYYAIAAIFFAWYILSGRNAARFRPSRLQPKMFGSILRVGALAALSSVVTNATIGSATALIAHRFGSAVVAGFGTGARLEYLLVPLIFGVGGTLVAMVGMNTGAQNGPRARHIAFAGAAICLGLTEILGVTAAIFPSAWLNLFGSNADMVAAGSIYLRIVGPFYGFYGFGFALYFANQGAGTLLWPVFGGVVRLAIVAAGGWLALALTASVLWLYCVVALGLVVYCVILTGWTLRAAWGLPAASGASKNRGTAH